MMITFSTTDTSSIPDGLLCLGMIAEAHETELDLLLRDVAGDPDYPWVEVSSMVSDGIDNALRFDEVSSVVPLAQGDEQIFDRGLPSEIIDRHAALATSAPTGVPSWSDLHEQVCEATPMDMTHTMNITSSIWSAIAHFQRGVSSFPTRG